MAINSADAINNSSPDSRIRVKTLIKFKGKVGVIEKSVWDDATYSSVITESKDLINGSIVALFMPDTPDEVISNFHIDDIDSSYLIYHPEIGSSDVTTAYYDLNNDYLIDMFYVTEDGLGYLLSNPDGVDFLVGRKQELEIFCMADNVANDHDLIFNTDTAIVNNTARFYSLTLSEWLVTANQTIYLETLSGTIYPDRVIQGNDNQDVAQDIMPTYVVISTSLLDELTLAIQNSYSITNSITISDMINIIKGTYTPPEDIPPENMSGAE